MSFRDDPFLSRVHPLFWPVLWISLSWFAAWTRREMEAGRGGWLVVVEVTWYGRILIRERVPADWNGALARHSAAVARLLLEPQPALPQACSAIRALRVHRRAEPARACPGRPRLAMRLARATGPPGTPHRPLPHGAMRASPSQIPFPRSAAAPAGACAGANTSPAP